MRNRSERLFKICLPILLQWALPEEDIALNIVIIALYIALAIVTIALNVVLNIVLTLALSLTLTLVLAPLFCKRMMYVYVYVTMLRRLRREERQKTIALDPCLCARLRGRKKQPTSHPGVTISF